MPVYVFGDVHVVNAFRSSEHWKVAPVSVAPNPKVALTLVLTVCGAELMKVSGGVSSPSTMRPAVGGRLELGVTDRVRGPGLEGVRGRARAPCRSRGSDSAPTAALSSLHSNVVPSSSAERRNDALVLDV